MESEEALKEYNLTPLVEVVGIAQGGVEPLYMGLGPVPAIRNVLQNTNMTLKDMGLLELNEAFSAQSLGVLAELVDEHNLTKEEIVNSIYMQIGYSKKISENLLEDFFEIIFNSLKKSNKVKIAKFGTFQVRFKKSRIGRNPKTKEKKVISERKVILFKPSKELKKIINKEYESKT